MTRTQKKQKRNLKKYVDNTYAGKMSKITNQGVWTLIKNAPKKLTSDEVDHYWNWEEEHGRGKVEQIKFDSLFKQSSKTVFLLNQDYYYYTHQLLVNRSNYLGYSYPIDSETVNGCHSFCVDNLKFVLSDQYFDVPEEIFLEEINKLEKLGGVYIDRI